MLDVEHQLLALRERSHCSAVGWLHVRLVGAGPTHLDRSAFVDAIRDGVKSGAYAKRAPG